MQFKSLKRIICCFTVFIVFVVFGFEPQEADNNPDTYHLALLKWLIAEGLPIAPDDIILLPASEKEDETMLKESKQIPGSRPGIYKSCLIYFDHENPPVGSIKTMPDGGFVWTIGVSSKNASSLRLHFSGFNLPDNCQLYIYNKYGQATAPYIKKGPHGNGEFWTETMFGNTLYVQLRSYRSIYDADLKSPGYDADPKSPCFVIDRVAHLSSQIASLKLEKGIEISFAEIFPGLISISENKALTDTSALAKYDLTNINVVDLYKSLVNTQTVPDELLQAMNRKKYMSKNFPNRKKPDFLEIFRQVENINDNNPDDTLPTEIQEEDNFQLINNLAGITSTRIDDSKYPRSKFITNLYDLYPLGSHMYLYTRRTSNTCYYINDIWPVAAVLTASFDGNMRVKVYARVWWEDWIWMDTDDVREGRARSTKVRAGGFWDFDIYVRVIRATNNGYHTGVKADT